MRLLLVCPRCQFGPDFNANDAERAADVLSYHRAEFHDSAYMVEVHP